jgi:hypothetical protein
MNRKFVRITVVQDENGYSVLSEDAGLYTGSSSAHLPPLANGQSLDADAASATVAAALEQWSRYEEKEGWSDE